MYAPRCVDELLRRDCSPDYSQDDIGEPVLEVELQPGVRPSWTMSFPKQVSLMSSFRNEFPDDEFPV